MAGTDDRAKEACEVGLWSLRIPNLGHFMGRIRYWLGAQTLERRTNSRLHHAVTV